MTAMIAHQHPSPQARLARAVRLRLEELGLSQAGAAQIGPRRVSESTWRRVETAKPDVTDTTLRRIDRVLQWAPGSCRRILDGGDPMPIEETPPSPTVDAEMADRTRIIDLLIGIDPFLSERARMHYRQQYELLLEGIAQRPVAEIEEWLAAHERRAAMLSEPYRSAVLAVIEAYRHLIAHDSE